MDLTIILPTINYFRFVVYGMWYYIPAHLEGESLCREYTFEATVPTNHAVVIREWV